MLGPMILILAQVVLARPDNSYIKSNNPRVPSLSKHARTNHRWLATLASFKHCHNPILALSIMEVESNFRSIRAKDESSTGIMQVKPETAKWIGCKAQDERSLLNIELNIACGCRYLGKIADTYSNRRDQVAAYNAGQARICRTGILRPSGKSCIIGQYINQDYVNKVMGVYYGYVQRRN